MHLLFYFPFPTLLHSRQSSFGSSECNRVSRGQFIVEVPPMGGEDSFLQAKTIFLESLFVQGSNQEITKVVSLLK